MRHLIVIIVAFAFCLSAQAETLIFQTTTGGQQFKVADKIVEKKSERGYLVINADLANPDSVTVNEAQYLHYEKRGSDKIQYTTLLNSNNVELILVDIGKGKKMVLRWFDDPTGTYTVVYGTAALKDIGGLQRYVSSSLSGNSVWREIDYRTGSGSIKLKLDAKATVAANTQGMTVEEIINSYEQELEAKGYIAE